MVDTEYGDCYRCALGNKGKPTMLGGQEEGGTSMPMGQTANASPSRLEEMGGPFAFIATAEFDPLQNEGGAFAEKVL